MNKSLVRIANRPVLSHLIEQFPDDAEFVVALGHKGELIREFVALVYPHRKFFFADVHPFEGPGSGLGLSLLACREYLQQPFVFISCDTLVREPIPAPVANWTGYAEGVELEPYRTLKVSGQIVEEVCEKGDGSPRTHKPYIGLSGIRDYAQFWDAMVKGGADAIQSGEAHGLRALLPLGIKTQGFTWFDTGSIGGLAAAREAYSEPDAPNILEKANEAIWFVDGQVIKFSDDTKFIANRVKRGAELRGYVPDVTGVQPHMYRYSMVEGRVLSDMATVPLFSRLLEHAMGFWNAHPLDDRAKNQFRKVCGAFYRDKTHERVELFFKTFEREDLAIPINGAPMPMVRELLDRVDWDWISDGAPGRFHGDFHFENIIWSTETDRFIFLDWRQDFGGSLATGDVYYDLAKLLHGLIVSHEIIARNGFSVAWSDDNIAFTLERKPVLVECEKKFAGWLEEQGYDAKKVRTLTALIYLNIAPLHHYPYSLMLFALGKFMLCEELNAG